MQKNKGIMFLAGMLCFVFLQGYAGTVPADLARLQTAYPDFIQQITADDIVWRDGSKMLLYERDASPAITEAEKRAAPNLADQIQDVQYKVGRPQSPPQSDPGRVRYDPFFRKMYGNTPAEVEQHLTTIYWMSGVFGQLYPLQVTTINGVDKKLQQVSDALEKLPASYYPFLENPAGTFLWRVIAHTQRLSPHSFGIAIDLNTRYSHYWQWDLKKAGQAVSEATPLRYHNQIPWEIVDIFEKQGFIWGGKWYHYDTMHFEYRPELLGN
jgi:peptidoglycan L-alanyl-D-glutamate endopeptidase CwlK